MKVFIQRFIHHFFVGMFPPACPRVTPLAALFICIIVPVAFLSHFGKDTSWMQALSITRFTFVDGGVGWKSGLPEIRQGQVWRLVSPFLCHFSFQHLAGNSLGLWIFGTQFEWKHGSVRFLVFVVVAQIVTALAVYSSRGPYFGGSSGVVYALAGYLFWRARVQRVSTFKMEWFVAVLILIELLLSALGISRGSMTAHLSGLAFGVTVALLIAPSKCATGSSRSRE